MPQQCPNHMGGDCLVQEDGKVVCPVCGWTGLSSGTEPFGTGLGGSAAGLAEGGEVLTLPTAPSDAQDQPVDEDALAVAADAEALRLATEVTDEAAADQRMSETVAEEEAAAAEDTPPPMSGDQGAAADITPVKNKKNK